MAAAGECPQIYVLLAVAREEQASVRREGERGHGVGDLQACDRDQAGGRATVEDRRVIERADDEPPVGEAEGIVALVWGDGDGHNLPDAVGADRRPADPVDDALGGRVSRGDRPGQAPGLAGQARAVGQRVLVGPRVDLLEEEVDRVALLGREGPASVEHLIGVDAGLESAGLVGVEAVAPRRLRATQKGEEGEGEQQAAHESG